MSAIVESWYEGLWGGLKESNEKFSGGPPGALQSPGPAYSIDTAAPGARQIVFISVTDTQFNAGGGGGVTRAQATLNALQTIFDETYDIVVEGAIGQGDDFSSPGEAAELTAFFGAGAYICAGFKIVEMKPATWTLQRSKGFVLQTDSNYPTPGFKSLAVTVPDPVVRAGFYVAGIIYEGNNPANPVQGNCSLDLVGNFNAAISFHVLGGTTPPFGAGGAGNWGGGSDLDLMQYCCQSISLVPGGNVPSPRPPGSLPLSYCYGPATSVFGNSVIWWHEAIGFPLYLSFPGVCMWFGVNVFDFSVIPQVDALYGVLSPMPTFAATDYNLFSVISYAV